MSARERQTLSSTRGYGPSSIEWIKSDLFCPNCGRQDMWQASDDGEDYYLGITTTCFSCKNETCCLDDQRGTER